MKRDGIRSGIVRILWVAMVGACVSLVGTSGVLAQGQTYRINASDLVVIDVVGEKDLAAIEKRVSEKGRPNSLL